MKNYLIDEFSWVVEDKLGGMPYPGLFYPADDMRLLSDMGITLLVTLTMEKPPEMFKGTGIRTVHFPVRDFHAPTVKQLYEFSLTVEEEMQKGGKIAVHCYAGMGRTGTFLSSWFVYKGSDPDDAIGHVRSLRPGSIETDEQEESVRDFYRYLKNKCSD